MTRRSKLVRDYATGARSHSARATIALRSAATARTATMAHSRLPLPWSGSTANSVSIQSGHAAVSTARAAARPLVSASNQNLVLGERGNTGPPKAISAAVRHRTPTTSLPCIDLFAALDNKQAEKGLFFFAGSKRIGLGNNCAETPQRQPPRLARPPRARWGPSDLNSRDASYQELA